KGRQKLYEISEEFQFEDEKLYPEPCLANISDSKHIVLTLKRNYPYDIGRVNELNAPNLEGEIDSLNFLVNSDLVIVKGKPTYRAYIFSNNEKNNDKWDCKRMIELKYFTQSHVTSSGKLLLEIADTTVLLQWNLKKLILEQQYLLNKFRSQLKISFNDNSTLLAVHGLVYDSANNSSYKLFIYSTELGILLAQSNNIVNCLKSCLKYILLALMWEKDSLSDPVDATKLFKNSLSSINDAETSILMQQYAIQSDTIIIWLKGSLYMQTLVQKNWIKWIEYLRINLGDYSNIGSPYSVTRIKLMIHEIIKLYNDSDRQEINLKIEPPYKGTIFKWGIEIDDDISLVGHRLIKTEEQLVKTIFILFKKQELLKHKKKFILNCGLLENDNLAMITI
ncbi:15540_t:CDS:2, partial [Racocetra persica]